MEGIGYLLEGYLASTAGPVQPIPALLTSLLMLALLFALVGVFAYFDVRGQDVARLLEQRGKPTPLHKAA